MDSATDERRGSNRYVLQMTLTYRAFMRDSSILAGSSKTVNISSKGILFSPPGQAAKGTLMELLIHWPVPRASLPVEFVVLGRVVRQEDRGTAVRILRHGFGCNPSTIPTEESVWRKRTPNSAAAGPQLVPKQEEPPNEPAGG